MKQMLYTLLAGSFLQMAGIIKAADQSTKAPASGDAKIVPAVRISGIHIGDSPKVVEGRMGETSFQDAAMGKLWEKWELKPGEALEIYASRFKSPDFRVEEVRTTAPSFATANGLHVGCDLSEMRKLYPKSKLVELPPDTLGSEKAGIVIYDAEEDGIAFEFRKGKCVAIVVHEKNGHARPDMVGGYFSAQTN